MAQKQLDVYRDWLGIQDADRPLNYYQLLRLKKFEDDPVRVRAHYRKLNAHVRKYSSGEFAKESQDLLNELAKAMLCLTDAKRKAEYDASLGREDTGEGRRRTFEEILLLRKVIDQAQLEKARKYADAVGLDVHDALVQQKMVKPEIVMQVYAESLGLPYVDLGDLVLDKELLSKVPAVLARQHSCAPVLVDEGQLLMASPRGLNPDVEEELRLRIGMPVRSVLCTPVGINSVINAHYPREAAAAEMAAGSGAAPADAKQADGSAANPAAAAEATRRQRMLSAIVLAWTVVGTMVFQTLLGNPLTPFWQQIGIALGLGVLVAGTVYFVLGSRKG